MYFFKIKKKHKLYATDHGTVLTELTTTPVHACVGPSSSVGTDVVPRLYVGLKHGGAQGNIMSMEVVKYVKKTKLYV